MGKDEAPAQSGELSLTELRHHLLRLEETIIFALIERAHFARNDRIYARGSESVWTKSAEHGDIGSTYSFLEFFMKETERVQALLGRYVMACVRRESSEEGEDGTCERMPEVQTY